MLCKDKTNEDGFMGAGEVEKTRDLLHFPWSVFVWCDMGNCRVYVVYVGGDVSFGASMYRQFVASVCSFFFSLLFLMCVVSVPLFMWLFNYFRGAMVFRGILLPVFKGKTVLMVDSVQGATL